jgi:flagellar hook-associated protein 3 FlgL
MNTQQADLMHLYQQIGSGQRMVTPADDPLAASQAINLGQSQSLNQRYAENRQVAQRNLGESENTLNSVTLVLQDVKTRLIEAGNGTLSDADRSTLSSVLKDARTNLLNFANAKDGSGQYLFSGAKGNVTPFQEVNGSVVYKGDASQRRVQADGTRQIPTSDVGLDIFGRAAPGTSAYLTRVDTSTVGSPKGTGVISSAIIEDPSGANVGNTFTLEFKDDGATPPAITYDVNVTDTLGNTSTVLADQPYNPNASDRMSLPGGVSVSLTGAPLGGDKFIVEPANVPDYVATAGGVNSGGVLAGSVSVTDYSVINPSYTYNIEFTAADEYTLVVNDDSGTAVSTTTGLKFTPGKENTLELSPGLQVKISGTPAAGDTFNINPVPDSAKADLNIFDTLDSIITELGQPVSSSPASKARLQSALASAVQRVDINYNNVLTVRSSVGARMNELDAMDANGQQRSLGYSKELSRLEDLDYYTATTQLQLRSSALQAASMAFQKIQSLSLFNMGS